MGWLAAIPLLPALAFFAMLPMSRAARNRFKWLPLLAMSGSLGLSVAAFLKVVTAAEGSERVFGASVVLGRVGEAAIRAGVRLDEVSGVMLLVVTIVGICVQVYSFGYMHRDERPGWYFAVLSLFSAAMLTLVLADNFLMLYMAWEVMGLCSYLLIGFWHEQEAPRRASLKAFLTTRVGDVGFAIGLAVMWATAGSFDFDVVARPEVWQGAAGAATAVSLLFLLGAMGKSAQVPLHVWLPDAMAGPTPASALIHAATMVAAGVYLVARALPIFHAAPATLGAVLAVGLVTAIVGGLLAVVQYDIKKVLAYSTISQLGYMFVALGAGSEVAGLFHLTTHAFFKSLLFLGAGVIIHAARTQDIREMGGLRKVLPWTTVAFTTGSLALAGVPPFSGFFSKDEILTVLWHGGHYVAFALALVAALITAFYVARLWFRVFGTSWTCSLAHEGHADMIAPMVLLAGITAVLGFASPTFAGLLGEHGAWPDPALAVTSSAVALAGLAAGWWVYGRRAYDTAALKTSLAPLYGALTSKLYFDLTYEHVLVRPFVRAAAALSEFDARVVDGAVNGAAALWRGLSVAGWRLDVEGIDGTVNALGRSVRRAGAALRKMQVGDLQAYQRFAYLAVLLFVAWMLFRGF